MINIGDTIPGKEWSILVTQNLSQMLGLGYLITLIVFLNGTTRCFSLKVIAFA